MRRRRRKGRQVSEEGGEATLQATRQATLENTRKVSPNKNEGEKMQIFDYQANYHSVC